MNFILYWLLWTFKEFLPLPHHNVNSRLELCLKTAHPSLPTVRLFQIDVNKIEREEKSLRNTFWASCFVFSCGAKDLLRLLQIGRHFFRSFFTFAQRVCCVPAIAIQCCVTQILSLLWGSLSHSLTGFQSSSSPLSAFKWAMSSGPFIIPNFPSIFHLEGVKAVTPRQK